jgi:hypothetical protein
VGGAVVGDGGIAVAVGRTVGATVDGAGAGFEAHPAAPNAALAVETASKRLMKARRLIGCDMADIPSTLNNSLNVRHALVRNRGANE